MTLLVSWLTPFGVVMVGDSALTTRSPDAPPRVSNDRATKVFWFERLKLGVSAWGLWDTGDRLLHQWLPEFLSTSNCSSPLELAEALALALRGFHGPNGGNVARAGMHVVGYESVDGGLFPFLFHVQDGPTQAGWCHPETAFRDRFEAVKDVTGIRSKSEFERGQFPAFRNGDYSRFAELQDAVNALRASFSRQGIVVPHPGSLQNYGEYAVFQVRAICDLYRMSNILPGIGGRIDCLMFNQDGIVRFDQHHR